jgi:hypothetical protein
MLSSIILAPQYPAAYAGACVDNDGDLFYANDACRPNLDPDDNDPCIPDPNSAACNSSSQSIQEINDVISDVQNLIASGDFEITSGQTNSLLSKLHNAIDSIEDNKINTAINKLNSFINQINAFINSGAISQEDGQALISEVQNIINDL